MKIVPTFLLVSCLAAAAPAPRAVPVPLPDAKPGIGFDDLVYAPGLKKVLAPAGRSGNLVLVDPATRAAAAIAGFKTSPSYAGGHDDGVTSADEGGGVLFATDRTALTISVVDPARKKVVASAPLATSPDYARWVAATSEVWVSEPDKEQIEVFAFTGGEKPALTRAALIPVPGGPESLVVDASRGKAYAHLWKGRTVAVDVKTRAVGAAWPNGCEGSRGIALDEKRGWVFAGCKEGAGTVLDALHDGKVLSSLKAGDGVDVIAYDPARRHLYLPGAHSATMAVVAVAADGGLSLLGTVPTAKGAHCATADDRGGVWVCDPDRGRLLFYKDSYGAAR